MKKADTITASQLHDAVEALGLTRYSVQAAGGRGRLQKRGVDSAGGAGVWSDATNGALLALLGTRSY